MKALITGTTALAALLIVGLTQVVPAMAAGTVMPAACNQLDVVGNGGDLTEGNSTGVPTGLGFDVGTGICNGSFTVSEDSAFPSAGGPKTERGIELGMRATHRFSGSLERIGANSDTYIVKTGFRVPLDSTSGSWWGFQHSIAYDGNISDLDELKFFIRTDEGTSIPADFGTGNGIFDMRILRAFFDDRHFTSIANPNDNPTPEWNDIYQTSQAPAFVTFGWLQNAGETALYDVDEEGAWTFTLSALKDGQLASVSICIETEGASNGCDPAPTVYTCAGETPGSFEPPMDKVVSVKKKNRVLPLKMICTNSAGEILGDGDISAPTVEITKSDPGGAVTDDGVEFLSSGKGDDGNIFVFDPETGKWQFNLSTKNFDGSGTYAISVAASGSELIVGSPTATFVVQ